MPTANKVQVVFVDGTTEYTVDQFKEVYSNQIQGIWPQNPPDHPIQFCEEMAGMPIVRDFAGPMYGGPGIARYESWAAYRKLSAW
jgi:hypothetical protein